jgi:cytoskeletal protein CcmA (bactofilin family)
MASAQTPPRHAYIHVVQAGLTVPGVALYTLRSMAQPDPSVVAAGTVVRGTLRGAEETRVDGRVEGTILIQHHVEVTASGSLQAEATVVSMSVAGRVEGTLTAEDFIQLLPGASVQANLKAPRIILEEGVRFVGRIEMDVVLPKDV